MRTPSIRARGLTHGPIRTCIGCRSTASVSELLRVVIEDGVVADGQVGRFAVPDPRRRKPGRGAWLHRDLACLRLAERRRAFSRALRAQGKLDTSAVQSHVNCVAHEVTGAGPTRIGIGRKQVDPS